jgi:predicted dehydrogenase
MNIAIVGCGLIGQKRLAALGAEHRLVSAVDTVLERAHALASGHPEAQASSDWKAAVARSDVDAVIVSTTNNFLAPITLAAVRAGKHVLVEKPAARTPEELDPVIAAAESAKVCVQVGFNHRYHPGFQKARELVDSGNLGPLLFIRGRYGHGGRLGYEKEWRANREIAGGGELLDQGVHLIDLARWFAGDFQRVTGCAPTYFWNMEVEDNGFLLLRTAKNQVAQLHVSWTEWKNLFSFEIYLRHAKLEIQGLGGSYGLERLAFYQMAPGLGPPETTIWEYPGEDQSWRREFQAFVETVRRKQAPGAGLRDARAALEVVHRIYRESRS